MAELNLVELCGEDSSHQDRPDSTEHWLKLGPRDQPPKLCPPVSSQDPITKRSIPSQNSMASQETQNVSL